jgi:hypothetical protein
MNKIEVADHPLRRLRNGFIVEMSLAAIPARFPGQAQLLMFILE